LTTLKDAQAKGKLADFIKEHEKDHDGDEVAFEATLKNLAQSPKSDRKTSSRGKSDD
jgi:hypothetical protein